MKVLEKLSDALDKICGVLIVVMIGAMVIVTSAQIVCRTWFTAHKKASKACRFKLRVQARLCPAALDKR